MSLALEEGWKWLKTAPLPVVLALVIALGGWVWRISNAQAAAAVRSEESNNADRRHEQKLDKLDEKMDKLLEAVLELKAEQRAGKTEPTPVQPAPAPTPSPKPASKAKKEDK